MLDVEDYQHHRLEIDSPSRGRKQCLTTRNSDPSVRLEIDSPSRGRKLIGLEIR